MNASKAELYVRANAWMIESFRDARSVIQFSDKEEGEIIGRYFLHNTVGQMKAIDLSHVYHDPQPVFAIIRIRVKDGLAKIIITPDAYRTRTGTVNNDFTYPEESLRKDIEQLLSDFTEYMNQDPGRF